MMQAPVAAPTLLDRAIAAVAPRAGVKRLIARQAFDGLAQRAYDGAARGRRTDGWRSTDYRGLFYNAGANS